MSEFSWLEELESMVNHARHDVEFLIREEPSTQDPYMDSLYHALVSLRGELEELEEVAGEVMTKKSEW